MSIPVRQQFIISGVGGQGILFITHLLAEAAMHKGLPVFTSENHGMAQRGGTVLSHIKVGAFFSPLIIPSHADGLLVLREENLAQHGFYLGPKGWAVINAKAQPGLDNLDLHWIDADRLAGQMGNPRAVNLIVLGFAVARVAGGRDGGNGLFCSAQDIRDILHEKFAGRGGLLTTSVEAFEMGVRHGSL